MAGAGCVNDAAEGPCTDGNACTTGDQCVNGSCTSGAVINCDDEEQCTTEYCDAESGCVITPNNVPCDDGNPCTESDTCAEGICTGQGGLECDDGNPCTTDSCIPGQGCLFTPNNLPCDDENSCTVGEQCSEGTCGG